METMKTEYIHEHYHVDNHIVKFECCFKLKNNQVTYPKAKVTDYRKRKRYAMEDTLRYPNGYYPTYSNMFANEPFSEQRQKKMYKHYHETSVCRELPLGHDSYVQVGLLPNQLEGRMYYSQIIEEEDIPYLVHVHAMVYQDKYGHTRISFQFKETEEPIDINIRVALIQKIREMFYALKIMELTLLVEGYNNKENDTTRTKLEKIATNLLCDKDIDDYEIMGIHQPRFYTIAQQLLYYAMTYDRNEEALYINEPYLEELDSWENFEVVDVVPQGERHPIQDKVERLNDLRKAIDTQRAEKTGDIPTHKFTEIVAYEDITKKNREEALTALYNDVQNLQESLEESTREYSVDQIQRDKQSVESYLRGESDKEEADVRKIIQRLRGHTNIKQEKDYYSTLLENL